MPPIKDWNTQSRKLKTANSCLISRTVTWRRISPTVWLQYGVLQKLWKSKRRILTRCLRGVRKKCTKNISWTHSFKAKISLHPEHRRDTDSLLWNPSCRHLALRVRLYSKSYLSLVVLELLTVVGDELKTLITNLILVLDVNNLFYESCYGIWYQKRVLWLLWMFEKKINIVERFLLCFVYKTPEIIAYASYKINVNFWWVSPIKKQEL